MVLGAADSGLDAVLSSPRMLACVGVLIVLILVILWVAFDDWRFQQAQARKTAEHAGCCCAVSLLDTPAHPSAHGLDCPIRRRWESEIARIESVRDGSLIP